MLIEMIKKSGGFCKENDELILELILSESQSLLTNPQCIQYILNSHNSKLIYALDESILKDSNLHDQVLTLYNPPESIFVDYFPLSDKYASNNFLLSETNFDISDSKKELLKKISTDEQLSFKLKFILSKHSFLKYDHVDVEVAGSIVDQHKALMTLAISGAILFSSVSDYVTYLKKDKPSSKIVHSKSSYIDSLFFEKFGNMVYEIEHLPNSEPLILALNNLTQEDLNFINTMKDSDDLSDSQEQYKDTIVNNLVSIIKAMQEERLRVKTQKKVQSEEDIRAIAESIVQESIANNIDYRILSSIIMQESKFDQGAVSSSGDIALTQINYEIWKPEFKQMGIKLNKDQLKKDENYAIWAMGKILTTIRDRHGSDPYWYARYHSSTASRKMPYAQLVNDHFYEMNQKQLVLVQEKIDKILLELKKTNYKDQTNIDVTKIDSFVFQLIQIKFHLDKQDVPARIAVN